MSMLQSKSQEHQMKLQQQQGKHQELMLKQQIEHEKSSKGQQEAHEQTMAQQQQQWQSKEYEELRKSNERQQTEQITSQEKFAKQRLDYEKEKDKFTNEMVLAKITGDAETAEKRSKAIATHSKSIRDKEKAYNAAQAKYAVAMGARVDTLSHQTAQNQTALAREAQLMKDITESLGPILSAEIADLFVDPTNPDLVTQRGPESLGEGVQEGMRFLGGDRLPNEQGPLEAAGMGWAGKFLDTLQDYNPLAASVRTLMPDQPGLYEPMPAEKAADALGNKLVDTIVQAVAQQGIDQSQAREFLDGAIRASMRANSGSGAAGDAAKAEFQKLMQDTNGVPMGAKRAILEAFDEGVSTALTAAKAKQRELQNLANKEGREPDGAEDVMFQSLVGGLKLLSGTIDRTIHMGGIYDPREMEADLDTLQEIYMADAEPQKKLAMIENLKKTAPDSYKRLKAAGKIKESDFDFSELSGLQNDMERVEEMGENEMFDLERELSDIDAGGARSIANRMQGLVDAY